jgi:putative hemolysin
MEELAKPVPPEVLAAELMPHMKIREYNGLEVYVTTAAESPGVMEEIGRIREREYRAVGAGRGASRDTDDHDTGRVCYKQIVAWDPEEEQLVAMYRFILGVEALEAGDLSRLRTAGLFDYSDEFREGHLPFAVELGRSVVNREAKRAIIGLYVVWAGLGALVVEFPQLHYFFGNVSIYSDWPQPAVDGLLAYLYEHHPGPDGAIRARDAAAYRSAGIARERERRYRGVPAAEAFERLSVDLNHHGLAPPPILLSYLKATDALAVFDTARDGDFGGALETAIWVPTEGLTSKTRRRFIDNYTGDNPEALQRYRPVSW